MKKLARALAVVAIFAGIGHASDIVLKSSSIINGTLAANTTNDLDLDANFVDALSVQVVYATAPVSVVSFTDGQTSTMSVIVKDLNSLTTAYASEKITVASNSAAVKAVANITIISTTGLTGQSLTITEGANSYVFTSSGSWASDGLSVTNAAASLAALISSSSYLGIQATNVAGVIYATATLGGLAQNSWSMTSSSPTVMSASATFSGGREYANKNQTITVTANGVTATLKEGFAWTQQDVSSNTAISICTALLNNFGTIFTSTVAAGSTVVYSTSIAVGSASNAWTVTASTIALTVSSTTFVGGQDNATLTIGGFTIQAIRDFTVGASSAITANNIRAAISTGPLSFLLSVSTNQGPGIVTATSTQAGFWTNFALVSSTPTALLLSQSVMTRGADSDVIYNYYPDSNQGLGGYGNLYPLGSVKQLSSIQKSQVSWGLGQAVLLSTTGSSVPTPLKNQTTYYALSIVAASKFQLSDTSTGAIAGVALTFSTATAVGGDSFTLTPLVLVGTPTFKLQYSNDDVNFQDVSISTSPLLAPFVTSTSFISPYTASSSFWNIGNVYARWLRFLYVAPTQGATSINYIVNGKKFAN